MSELRPTTPFGALLCDAITAGVVDSGDTAVVFVDRDHLDRQLARVRQAFPDDAVHSVAVKTNPLACVLQQFAHAGAHAEAASVEEIAIAEAAGFGERIVWDSPAKTVAEINAVGDRAPWLVNVDSLDELDRHRAPSARLGLRVNPGVEPDTIAQLATGSLDSKFGVPLSERSTIVQRFRDDPRLIALHVHSGSRMRSLGPMVDAVGRTVELADEINVARAEHGRPPVAIIDIGGGLPSSGSASDAGSVERYSAELRQHVPKLFDGTYRIVTEFGRLYHEDAGWTASRVEYVKERPDRRIAVVHVGADSFVREVYDRDNWQVEVEAAAALTGRPVTHPDARWDVAGPLCFEGDVVARDRPLGDIAPGDWLVLRPTGANTLALWSRHCSRLLPKVVTYHGDRPDPGFAVGKPRERIDEMLAFWGYR